MGGYKSSSTKNWSRNSQRAHSWAAQEGTFNLPKRIFLAIETWTTHDTPVTTIATVLVIVFISRCPLRLCHPTPESLSQKCSSECHQQTGSRAAKVRLHCHLAAAKRSRSTAKGTKRTKKTKKQKKVFSNNPMRSLKTVKTELKHGRSQWVTIKQVIYDTLQMFD